ncbi:MarR family winged helix-turn-helix transcriptional regulator [Enemella evansiae]|uniref:MarR family winged helix-turn-helix transcriptional regulator n=1 Tax=Enemella evansiae TaxID=2016499 RepID=UPI000B95DC97|nr:MarR family transcriptional regulator [Enemella evansiae]OYO02620.1 ArsR family transcriptional regulator [Enemella evansiae]
MSSTAEQLTQLLGPLRRALLRSTQGIEGLPNLPDAQIELLRALAATGEITPGDLAAQVGLARSTVSNLLRVMGADGLVERRLNTSDGRSTVLVASPRALELLERYDQASSALLDEVFTGLTDEERRRLADALPVLNRLQEELSRR